MEGWIKLHRELLQNSLMKKSEYLSIWIYCLLRANHEKNFLIIGGEKIIIKSGQFITSRSKIATATGVQESKVERILKFLKSEQQIEQQNLFKCRLITIVNWHKYQINEQQNELQVNSNRTASEQQVNTNKNDKNLKNEKNKIFLSLFNKIESNFTKEELQHKQDFLEHWTEKNIDGKKELWQMQKTFDINLRFKRWLRNAKEWGINKNSSGLEQIEEKSEPVYMPQLSPEEQAKADKSYEDFKMVREGMFSTDPKKRKLAQEKIKEIKEASKDDKRVEGE